MTSNRGSQFELCRYTLDIKDGELEREYMKQRLRQISYVSWRVLFAKFIYGCFVCYQYLNGTLGFQRNFIYQLALVAHYACIEL